MNIGSVPGTGALRQQAITYRMNQFWFITNEVQSRNTNFIGSAQDIDLWNGLENAPVKLPPFAPGGNGLVLVTGDFPSCQVVVGGYLCKVSLSDLVTTQVIGILFLGPKQGSYNQAMDGDRLIYNA